MYKIISVIFLFAILLLNPVLGYSASQEIVSYLCEMGIDYYNQGRYDDALVEFNSALLVDSDNKMALEYLEKIRLKKDLTQDVTFRRLAKKDNNIIQKTPPAEKKQRHQVVKEALSRNEPAFIEPDDMRESSELPEDFIDKVVGSINEKIDPVKISGEIRMGLGVTSEGDFLWKDADGNLNERDWHILYGPDRENTYDKRIFDRLRVDVDKEAEDGFGFHSNITIDPWSFTAKSDKMLVTSLWGDTAVVQLKYWSNTRHTIDEIYHSFLFGDAFNLPALKVVNDKTAPAVISSSFGNTFFIPAAELDRSFQPLRELWVDYKKENFSFRFFPIAYQDQALMTDDPLGFSNHHIYWEESPWLDKWVPGHINTGVIPQDFYKGKWDDTLSFYTRDSDNLRLTALRGFSFQMNPTDRTIIQLTSASPKDLWQDYDEFDSNKTAARIKHYLTDDISVGGTFTSRIGFNDNDIDAVNNLVATDAAVLLFDKVQAEAQVAYSTNTQDKTTPYYKTKNQGWSYYFSISSATTGIASVDGDYFSLKANKEQGNFAKARLYFAHMDKGFESPLSTYRQTRDDSYWARHLHFKKPFDFYYTGLMEPTYWEDIEPFAIGDGIDYGRQVVGMRIDSSFWNRFDNVFTVRNVNTSSGDYIETEVRDEATFKITDKLTSKVLGIYQDLPDTVAGVDPFIVDPDSGDPYLNANILGGQDPSLKTGSLGLEYQVTDNIAVNGIWEYTNDYTLAYDNFPRGLLNSATSMVYSEDNRLYRKDLYFLYNQNLFPLPPYDFYNIFKAGIRFTPIEELEIYLDFTRNDFRSAGQIDDNINHIGFEVGYIPFKKLGFYIKYTYSQWNDLAAMNSGGSDYYDGHHNVFAEIRYLPSKDSELIMQYGEGGYAAIGTVNFDPFGGALMTLDTQHIFRLFYKKKF